MTYQDLLQAQQTLSELDQSQMTVKAKVTVYRLLQYAEGELQTYQKTLQSITPSRAQSLSDLTDEERDEVGKLMEQRVETTPQSNLAQEQLPDSVTIQQIATLDRAGMLTLDEDGR